LRSDKLQYNLTNGFVLPIVGSLRWFFFLIVYATDPAAVAA
jgi:hypothetical protein